jgi:hypothetical protein
MDILYCRGFSIVDSAAGLAGMTGNQIRILGAGTLLSILLITKMFRTSASNKAKRQSDITMSDMVRRIEELEKKLAPEK